MPCADWVRVTLFGVAVLAAQSPICFPAPAQTLPPGPGGDASAGRRLSESWCTECHAIGPKTIGKGEMAPAFTAIANHPSTTALSLKVFFQSNHRAMPNFVLGQRETEDIVAYILSLKRK